MSVPTNQTRDPMTSFRSTIKGKNKKGDDRLQLYLTVEEAAALAANLNAQSGQSDGRGVKIDLHIGQRINSNTGHPFDSAYAFVKAVVESSTGAGRPTSFRPVAAVVAGPSAIETMTQQKKY